ncbi:GMC oxidoreductase [Nocardia sp. NPDC058176]|uniref:GMC oxidoreductase n=1 Tax=Nocardia sp. NPDC058176 TaxID=3346368 RepID=UPI0036DA1E4A
MTAWDAIVVGSGFGGAVAAGRLAERGLTVLVLERGAWWDRGTGAVRGVGQALRGVRYSVGSRARSLRVRRGGLYEVNQFDHLTCVVASGVGGGSLVYTDVQVQPPDHCFEAWPAEITGAHMRPYFDKVREMLSPAPVSVVSSEVRAFEQAARRAGHDGLRRPDLAASFDGGAYRRTTLDTTHLPLAVRHGATVRALTEVTAIDRSHRAWRVRCRDLETGRTRIESAPRLVLAAGTLGTLRLLFAARDRHRTLTGLGPGLGRGFTPNGDTIGLVRASSGRTRGGRPPISAYRADTLGGRELLTAEVGFPLPRFPFPRAGSPFLPAVTALFSMGADHIATDVDYNGRDLRITTSRDDDPDFFDRAREHAIGIGKGYNAGGVTTNVPFRGRGLFTVHPLGGARVSTGPEDGVVDHVGEVHGHPGLFVADGSVLPAAPGIPPSMTIAAFAERQAALIADR